MTEMIAMYALCPDIRYRIVADEGVVVRQEAGEVLVLNAVGARVMELLNKPMSAAGLVNVLAEEYDVERATLEQDLSDYLENLLNAGVIEDVPANQVD
jgi:hypothetical protein